MRGCCDFLSDCDLVRAKVLEPESVKAFLKKYLVGELFLSQSGVCVIPCKYITATFSRLVFPAFLIFTTFISYYTNYLFLFCLCK